MMKKIDEGSKNYGYKSGSTTINPIHNHHNNHHNNLHNFPLCNIPQQQQNVKRDIKLNERTVYVGSNGLLHQGYLPKKSSGLIKYNNNNSINSNNYNTYNNLNTKSK